MAVSNSSPLIHLSRLSKMGYLREIFPSITIPPAVRTETIEKGKLRGYADAAFLATLEKEGWLRTAGLSEKSRAMAEQLTPLLESGEAEAISLAVEKRERLLMDDHKGRGIARTYGVETTTSLGLMLELLQEKVITKSDYVLNVKNYGGQGWITSDVLEEFLEKAEELD